MSPQRRVRRLESKKVGFGEKAETVFLSYLINTLSHKILTKNFYYRLGEIDIISFKDNLIYFWEVKARHGTTFGYPEEAVTQKKIRKIEKGIEIFFQKYPQLQKYDYLSKIAALIFNSKNELVDLKVFDLL